MVYDLNFLQTFDGDILPSQINLSELVNVIEKHVSQFRYYYCSDSSDYPEIIIEFRNTHLPHLLGLSKNHHFSLPTYQSREIILNLKSEWDLDYLRAGDEQWFSESQYKLVGALLLYQLFRIQNCKVLTPMNIINTYFGKRFKRDNVYFVIFKTANGREYTIELALMPNSSKIYIPKSLKINDQHKTKCSEIDLTFLKEERIVSNKKRKKVQKYDVHPKS